MKFIKITHWGLLLIIAIFTISCQQPKDYREVIDFNENWMFSLADSTLDASGVDFDDAQWRALDVPHDWSIEGAFSNDHPAGAGGGALPGGIGWYRKDFILGSKDSGKKVFVQFDGIYMNSEVWVNGHFLGKRPFGYISFEYDLTEYLKYDGSNNVIAVKVDNAKQPNSRWYSGSGIYRNTRLIKTNNIYVPQWGVYVTTPQVSSERATINAKTTLVNESQDNIDITIRFAIKNNINELVHDSQIVKTLEMGITEITTDIELATPQLWSLEQANLYVLTTELLADGVILDQYETTFGIRTFLFDVNQGFTLNDQEIKIKGVCMHHDLGCLGSAINTRAIERQLEILKEMGVNAIRTSHNPPAPELLDLCDQMGILVMDETFDIWSMKKSPYDYALYWEDWHKRDIEDHIKRDRNHPSIISWSIGNEIIDQWSPEGATISQELSKIVKSLDNRPITAAMNPPNSGNTIAESGTMDLMGYNYHHALYEEHITHYPDKPFIATETTSALATRGFYDIKSDTLKRWPVRWDLEFLGGNEGNTVSAYDQVSTPWGSTHEETWKVIKNNKSLIGMFIWTGFDYLGEPTPYVWPSRSSYFGLVDLAGFPKDAYYMYQSEWTDQDVLYMYPHWNWEGRDSVDVWVYYNHADEVELYLNGASLGVKAKEGDDLHIMWRVPYEPGEIHVISRKNGQQVLSNKKETTGEAYQLKLTADRSEIKADGKDLSFITVEVIDKEGRTVPIADNLIEFEVSGAGKNVGVDNGDPTSHLSFKGNQMKAMAGKCLLVVQSDQIAGEITIEASSKSLNGSKITINSI